jgi:signal transduction histidine kinase
MRLQWHNDVAERQFVKGESVEAAVAQLARRAREMGKVTTQSMTVDEDRVVVQALPLSNGDVGIVTRAQAGENGANNDFYERFMRRIVHDMRNPLAAIIAHASNLQTAPDFERASATRTAQTIETEAQRLTRLVDSILFDARLSHLPLVLQRLDMRDVLEEVYYQHDERAEREYKSLEFETPPQAMPLDGDRDLLVRAIGNLVDNALKYSGTGAVIRLVGELSPGHTVVKVIDDGEGIPPEFLPDRIFEALVRVKPRDGVSGSGLGLNIVKKIVQMHGGTIMADSRLGQGTTMTILLPRED